MRRIFLMGILMLFLAGCGAEEKVMNDVLVLRNRIDDAQTLSFQCRITADYSDSVYVFGMRCEIDADNNLAWEVTEPETIAGITGRIINDKGHFVFDNEMLVFELLADGQITPVGSPWVLMKAIHSGYIRSCGRDDDNILVHIDDSFLSMQFSADVWINREGIPQRGEILWQGRRIVSIEISEFEIL